MKAVVRVYLVLLTTSGCCGAVSSAADVGAREKIRLLRQDIAHRLAAHGHTPESLWERQSWKTRRHLRRRRRRRLDDPGPQSAIMSFDDPCAAAVGTDVFVYNDRFNFAPSFWQACAESLPVDAENMVLHIESLDQLFRDYQYVKHKNQVTVVVYRFPH